MTELLNNPEINITNCKSLRENMNAKEQEKYDHIIQMLPLLKDKLKKEGNTYIEEFNRVLALFKEQFNVFMFFPNKKIDGFHNFLIFFAQLASDFPGQLIFFGKNLVKIISENYLIIPHETRLKIIDALSILCKTGNLPVVEVVPLYFNLLKCQDKILRKRLTETIVAILTKINEKHKNVQINKFLQNYVEGLLGDPNQKLARKTLNIVINLYKKNIWNDRRVINLISDVCVNSTDIKMCSAGCQFFLCDYEDIDSELKSSEEENDLEELKNKYKLLGKNKGSSKKTKKNKEKLLKLIKAIENKDNKLNKFKVNQNFMPIDQLNDPMSFCDGLYKRFNKLSVGNFKHKLKILRLLGRVLGRHKLVHSNFYNTMVTLLRVDQKDINVILASLIESCHDQIPPNVLDNVINKLFDVFISDIFPAKQITLGLTTLSHIIERCPYILEPKYFSVCEDLRRFKNKSVTNAAKNVVNLHKTFFNKNGTEIIDGFGFGDSKFDSSIKGIELLKKLEKKPKEYKMECEEILDERQLKKLKALNLKYSADLIQHRKINADEIIGTIRGEKVKKSKKKEEDEGELADDEESEIDEDEELEDNGDNGDTKDNKDIEGNSENDEGNDGENIDNVEEMEDVEDVEDMEDMEDIEDMEDREVSEEDDSEDITDKDNIKNNQRKMRVKSNENEVKKKNKTLNLDENLEEIEGEENEESEEIELDEDDLEQEEDEEGENAHGFIEPEQLETYVKTRRENLDELRNRGEQKEKYKLNHKRKREDVGKTNKEKLKNKPMSMLVPKKRLQSKINSDKVTQLNKRIRNLKQQFGKFKKNLKSKFNNKNRGNKRRKK